MQQFLREFGSHATPRVTRRIVDGLKTSLGNQTVSIRGVSPATHFAQVLVEADYRMKLIGIGLENPPVDIISYVARANPARVARNALQRWYFVPDYETVRMSDDGLAMELVGDGVKLVNVSEMVRKDGSRVEGDRPDRASQAFTLSFTKLYPQLAERVPVYAQLRNLIDMTIAAAFIQEQDYYGQINWQMDLIGRERDFRVETLEAPKQVATAVNAIWKGSTLMTPIGGGVHIQPRLALNSGNLLTDDDGQVAQTRGQIDLQELPADVWWWD
jgi:hypothetical protein